MNITNKEKILILIGFIGGTLYFQHMEKTIPKNANCSYLASPWTDHFAFIVSIYLIYFGIKEKKHIVLTMGVVICTEHIYQYIYHKLDRPMFTPISWEVFALFLLLISIFHLNSTEYKVYNNKQV